MASSSQLICRVAFEHAYFADELLRAMRIVPVAACHAMLQRAGVMLRLQEDGIAAFGDAAAVDRLRLHIDEAGAPLDMGFHVMFTDPHFAEYTAPAWPAGQLLFLDTARCTTDECSRQMLHATPCVPASAFRERDDADVVRMLGAPGLPPAPALLLQVSVSHRLLDTAVLAQRQFHVRFDAASSHWKYCLFSGSKGEGALAIVDLAGDIAFERFPDVDIADRQRADVFLSTCAIPMRQVSPARFQLRAVTAAGEKVLIKRMPNASVGKRFRESRDGNEILVSEIFINH